MVLTQLKVIAHLHGDFPTKFGLPRQSGLVNDILSRIVFEPEYRDPNAFRGIEGYSHLWLLWQFSDVPEGSERPTVRPPRLGGNTRVGVFATRSPFRPNPVGLSCVRLVSVTQEPGLGTVLTVSGADLRDGTPIFDIKPYLPYVDSVPDALGGFAAEHADEELRVVLPPELAEKLPPDKRAPLAGALAQDPRPAYNDDPERVFGFAYAGYEVRFTVRDGVATVVAVEQARGETR